ncbi:hypothetical protein LEP1GSC193_0828 [Leptospira alstonii serovar Pingchang str. 80-412]|uniref:Uncharacterized protein n=2 Tax=Leptospira alstonii TaxID=28452 RepID=M6CU75_9LEPT|nr:hypothetical protein LEP1GSC194_3608 [Leptospira alstonii serovar Sichuan str. 79601]EQA80120.1 hypothetical protein LEP1GSC193_0828 [Leptospira alstonii serovar Pingchang str. 80-412]
MERIFIGLKDFKSYREKFSNSFFILIYSVSPHSTIPFTKEIFSDEQTFLLLHNVSLRFRPFVFGFARSK